MSDQFRHQIVAEEDGKGYRCTVCGEHFNRWRGAHGYCPATGHYGIFAKVPKQLKTVGRWKELGKRPKKDEVATALVHMHSFGKSQWANLWDEIQVEDIGEK